MTTSSYTAPAPLQEILSAENVLQSGVLDDPQGQFLFLIPLTYIYRIAMKLVRAELIGHLPANQQSEEFLNENLRSPQFQQSLDSLTQVLLSEGSNSVLANLGVNPEPGQAELVGYLCLMHFRC